MSRVETSESREKVIRVSERIRRLREECIKSEPAICHERAVIITEAYKEHEDKQINIKRALAVAKVLDGCPSSY